MCGVRYARVATKSKREDGGDGARRRLKKKKTTSVPTDSKRDAARRCRGRVSETFRLFIASARKRGRKRRLKRVSETFRPRASLDTYRHGPALVPREDPAHALGHRLARPEVLLDAGPGRLSRARDARAIHRDAHAVRAERRRATPRRIPPRRLTPRRTKWRDLGTQQVCQEEKRKLEIATTKPTKESCCQKRNERSCRCRTDIPKKRCLNPEDAV